MVTLNKLDVKSREQGDRTALGVLLLAPPLFPVMIGRLVLVPVALIVIYLRASGNRINLIQFAQLGVSFLFFVPVPRYPSTEIRHPRRTVRPITPLSQTHIFITFKLTYVKIKLSTFPKMSLWNIGAEDSSQIALCTQLMPSIPKLIALKFIALNLITLNLSRLDLCPVFS